MSTPVRRATSSPRWQTASASTTRSQHTSTRPRDRRSEASGGLPDEGTAVPIRILLRYHPRACPEDPSMRVLRLSYDHRLAAAATSTTTRRVRRPLDPRDKPEDDRCGWGECCGCLVRAVAA